MSKRGFFHDCFSAVCLKESLRMTEHNMAEEEEGKVNSPPASLRTTTNREVEYEMVLNEGDMSSSSADRQIN